MRSECPVNKKGKKDKDKKKKKKVMMVTWSDSDPSSFDSEPKMKTEDEIKANLCFMAKEGEVCLDDIDDFDVLQNEYECLFRDFEKLRHQCKDYKKIITTLTLDVENAKHEYDVVVDNKNELEKCFDNLKSENEALRLELESKCKALNESLNENVALNVSMNEELKHDDHKHGNRHFRKKHVHTTCHSCRRRWHIAFYCNIKKKVSSLKIIWVSKGSYVD